MFQPERENDRSAQFSGRIRQESFESFLDGESHQIFPS